MVGGLYTLLGAVCLAELGTMLPEAGGYYVYARRAFGDTVGFAVGWTDWLTYCAVLGYVSIAIGEFAGAAGAGAGSGSTGRGDRSAGRVWWRCSGGRARQQPLSGGRRRRVKFVAFLALVVAAIALAGTPAASVTAAAQPPSISAA